MVRGLVCALSCDRIVNVGDCHSAVATVSVKGWRRGQRPHGLPRVDVVERNVRGDWQSVVEKALVDDLCQLLILATGPTRVLFVVERNLVALHKVVVKMNWKHLRVLHLLVHLFGKLLVVNVVLLGLHVSGRAPRVGVLVALSARIL